MKPDAVARYTFNCPVDCIDVLVDLLHKLSVGQILVQQHPFHREIGCVDLQDEAGIDYGFVFFRYLAHDRIKIVFVGL